MRFDVVGQSHLQRWSGGNVPHFSMDRIVCKTFETPGNKMRTSNPILQRELLYQRRTTPRWVQIMDSVGIVGISLLLALLLIQIMLSGIPFVSPHVNVPLVQWGQIFVWLIHIIAVIRAIWAGTATVSYDIDSAAWDDLKLTGISLRRLLFGKWWAAFYQVRGWIVALGIIRLALVALLMVSYVIGMHKIQLEQCYDEITRYSSMPECSLNISRGIGSSYYKGWQEWSPLFIPVSVSVVVGLSLLEMMASTAIGVAAGLLSYRQTRALLSGIIVRFIPVVVFSLWPNYYSGAYYVPASQIWMWRWSEYTWFSLADGGMTGVLRMAYTTGLFPRSGWRSIDGIPLALIAGFGMLILLFSTSMLASWVILRHQGFTHRR